ncbi:MAG: nitrogen fixation protein NifZ, partial [Dolichospermum sp.]
YYIYAVHFLETGYIIGCRKRELESAEEKHESNVANE